MRPLAPCNGTGQTCTSTHKRSDLHAQVFCNPWHNGTEFRTALVIECAHAFPLAHCGTNRLSAVASGSWLCATCCSESCTPLCFIKGVSTVGKPQWFPQTRSAMGFYGRLMGIGRLMRIELQHGGIDRISLVSQSRASEHRRHTSARHTQIYNMVESDTGGKTPGEKPQFLGCA